LGSGLQTLTFDTVDQYTVEAETFARAILEEKTRADSARRTPS
jgi:hypothetical protein